jgi:small GTP-binding protein
MGCPLAIDAPRASDFAVAFVGLDGAGKSQIVFRLTTEEAPSQYLALPTPGAAYSEFLQGKSTFRVYDCGGLGRYREQWGRYVRQSDAVVFVIDGADRGRLGRARAELAGVSAQCGASGAPLLVVVNKTDLKAGITTEEIAKSAAPGAGGAGYDVAECSAATSTGVQAVRDWLFNHVQRKARAPE